MPSKSLVAALLGGAVLVAGPAFAQGLVKGVGGATGGKTIVGTTQADNADITASPAAPSTTVSERVAEDGTVVVTRRETVVAGMERVYPYQRRVPNGGGVTGGVGGAIGGRSIIGASPADDAPLPMQH